MDQTGLIDRFGDRHFRQLPKIRDGLAYGNTLVEIEVVPQVQSFLAGTLLEASGGWEDPFHLPGSECQCGIVDRSQTCGERAAFGHNGGDFIVAGFEFDPDPSFESLCSRIGFEGRRRCRVRAGKGVLGAVAQQN